MRSNSWIETFPGGELVREGLEDFQSGRRTVPACLVSIARTRLSRAGLISKRSANRLPEPELQLYRLLRQEGGDAYSRYNSLLRELVSFENALERHAAANFSA
jgi:hypothetical protein